MKKYTTIIITICYISFLFIIAASCGTKDSVVDPDFKQDNVSNDNDNQDSDGNQSGDGQDDTDNDDDGFTENQGDCDDDNPDIYPGAEEICENEIDEDCDGKDLSCEDDSSNPGPDHPTPTPNPDTDACDYLENGDDRLIGPCPSQEFNSEVDPESRGECDQGECEDGTLTVAGGRFMEGVRVIILSLSETSDTAEDISSDEILSRDLEGSLWTEITADETFENTRNQDQTFTLVSPDADDIFGDEAILSGGLHRIVLVIDNEPQIEDPKDLSEIGENDMFASLVINVNGSTLLSLYHDDLQWSLFSPDSENGPISEDNDDDGFAENQGDCDDDNPDIYPGAEEICENEIDEDCDGEDLACEDEPDENPDDVDDDGDGFTENQNDCNDNNPAIHPGAEDICDNGVDEDCDGEDLACEDDSSDGGSEDDSDGEPDSDPDDVDDDGDGFTENQNDCNDNNPAIHPGAEDICGNGVDENCDGKDAVCPPDPKTVDNDKDNFTENQGDCNDKNKNIHPGARDLCGNGVDENCDGKDSACPPPRTVDNDNDGFNENQGDCNDANNKIYPGAKEVLDNKIDENCNGLAATEVACIRAKISGSMMIPLDIKEDCGL
jgi:hypothetical protein